MIIHRRITAIGFAAALGGIVAAGPAQAYSMVHSVTCDRIHWDGVPHSGLNYDHIYFGFNVCQGPGSNCAIIVFNGGTPEEINECHVLAPT